MRGKKVSTLSKVVSDWLEHKGGFFSKALGKRGDEQPPRCYADTPRGSQQLRQGRVPCSHSTATPKQTLKLTSALGRQWEAITSAQRSLPVHLHVSVNCSVLIKLIPRKLSFCGNYRHYGEKA